MGCQGDIVRRCCAVLVCAVCTVASAEQIAVEDMESQALPGETVSGLFSLGNSVSPLFGYSLDIEVIPAMDAVGTVSPNTDLTNFFDKQNLITAGGASRDTLFSQIIDTSDGGIFVTTNTDDNSTVLAVNDVNDVLAQVFFDISDNALGDFSITLGAGSALSDAVGFPVDFEFTPIQISVIPEPSGLAVLVFGVFVLSRRKVSSSS